MDIKRALKNVIETGKLTIGARETMKEIKKGKVKLVIVSGNCPPEELASLKGLKVPLYTFSGSNVELGAAAGKPFSISAIGIIEPGKSDILALKGEA